ncbi:hypothetical protein [Pseudolysinimonas yzui]|uniref:Uncharacterized protein n=1 Tax=Pseudolysinimonas yzui TaxID=2708254 RepID=A0A8J3GT59_9MICO|nr:hypothetical protein [Pseudolysinimonas yzui]GHF26877.1 hypothetical protein GCM10011600_29750 [Pseudolysinimonas yzui]
MADGIDPRYAAQFQRGYDRAQGGDPVAPLVEEDETPRRHLPAAVLLVLAGALLALAVASAVGAASATVPSGQREVTTILATKAPGPLLTSAVLAVILWAMGQRFRRPRSSAAVLATTAATLLALVSAVVWGLSRLIGLTAQGPVSSGGIPLPDAAMSTYLHRVQIAAVLIELLPWLVLAAAGALVGTVAVILSREPPRSRV